MSISPTVTRKPMRNGTSAMAIRKGGCQTTGLRGTTRGAAVVLLPAAGHPTLLLR